MQINNFAENYLLIDNNYFYFKIKLNTNDYSEIDN